MLRLPQRETWKCGWIGLGRSEFLPADWQAGQSSLQLRPAVFPLGEVADLL